jgi:CRISPR-associated protein Cas2
MICWVMYDIKDDRARTKISKACEKAGLTRVQFSVFLGSLEKSGADSLQLQIEELINPDKDSVYIFPMSRDELKQTQLLGQAFDKKLITDEITQLFI